MVGDGVLDVAADDCGGCLGGFRRVEAVFLHGAGIRQGLDPPRDSSQLQGRWIGPLPTIKGHPGCELLEHIAVDLIAFVATHQGLGKPAYGARVGDHHFHARASIQIHRQIQPVVSRRLQADPYQMSRFGQPPAQRTTARFRVEELLAGRIALPLPTKRCL